MAALVLPGEGAALPDVGPALPAAVFGGARLEGEAGALGVHLRRGGVAHQAAEIDEVLLGCSALVEVGGVPPFVDEGAWGHLGRGHVGSSSGGRSLFCCSRAV